MNPSFRNLKATSGASLSSCRDVLERSNAAKELRSRRLISRKKHHTSLRQPNSRYQISMTGMKNVEKLRNTGGEGVNQATCQIIREAVLRVHVTKIVTSREATARAVLRKVPYLRIRILEMPLDRLFLVCPEKSKRR